MSEPATPPTPPPAAPAAPLPALVADEPVKAPTLTRPKSNALGRMASLVQKQVVQAKEKEKAEKGELVDPNAAKSDGLLSRMANIVKKQTELAKEKAAAGLQHRKRDSVDDVAAQVELSRADGNIWSAMLKADMRAVREILETDPSQIEMRDPVGATPLHMAYLYNSPKHYEIAKWVIERFPDSITAVYTPSPLYEGENILHIAIVNRQLEMVKWLVHREPKLLEARATGDFFSSGSCYFGEYPLLFAACTNQKTLVEYLIDWGADMDMVDSNGNNILHLCVIHNLKEMYAWVLDLWNKRHKAKIAKGILTEEQAAKLTPLNKVRNMEHHTPFTLAADLGRKGMLEYILDSQKVHQWTYGHVSCHLYPLEELDPLPNPEDPHFRGACQIIVDNANLTLLSMPRIQQLMQTKWDKFAARPFLQRFIVTLICICIFLFSVVLKSEKKCGDPADGTVDANGVVLPADQIEAVALQYAQCMSDVYFSHRLKWFLEVIVVIATTFKAHTECRELFNSGWEYFGGSGSGFMENMMALNLCVCIYTAVICRLVGSTLEDIPVAIGSLVAWMYLLFFLLGFRLTGPFIVMLYRMLVQDVARFAVLVFVFFLGFSQALYVIFDDDGFTPFVVRIKALFLAMLGDFDFDDYSENRFPGIAVSLLVAFVIVVSIMLLNILIAMMGETYGTVVEEADKQWALERARIMYSIQNELTLGEINSPKYRYWTEVGNKQFLQDISASDKHFVPETPEVTIDARMRLGMAPRAKSLMPIDERKSD